MKEKNSVAVFCLCFFAVFSSFGKEVVLFDSTQIIREQKVKIVEAIHDTRYFNQLTIPSTSTNADPILTPHLVLADSTEYQRAKALEYHQEVTRKQSLVSSLNNLSLLELPVGLTKEGGDLNYTIIISQVRVDTKGAYLEAYFIFEIPQTGDKIAFRGTDIRFSHEGGLTGDGRLELIGNYPIKLNSSTLLTILGKGNTFVEFDCDGFKGMGIEAGIEFSRDLIVPEDEKGNIKPAPERVKTKFTVSAKSWNDLLVGINLPPFQVSSLKGVGFSVTNAFLDWSDLANPPGLMFPEGYKSPFVTSGQPKLWQGFYLQSLEVRLPRSFKKSGGDSTRISLGVENMIIDDQGFSGTAFIGPVLQAGDMSGWAYTIDRLGLEFVTNQVKGFEIEGRISIPVIKSKEDKPTQFGYLAQRSAGGDYIFAVRVEDQLKFPLFVADLKLYKGSTVMVKEVKDKFYPSAILNGELTINILGKGPKANFNSIRFEGLSINSQAPHFDIQTIGFGKEGQTQSVSKYPLVINNIALKKDSANRIGIGFDVTINIGGKSEDEGFGGTAALTVWGKREKVPVTSSEGQVTGTAEGEWKFDKVELSGIGVKFSKAKVIEIAGMIRFFDNDPIYGDGFKGSVSGKIQTISLQIEALFGKTPEFRYWYADALVEFESGVPLVPGFSAYGFGGGFYSKMKQSESPVGSDLGRNVSGITYVPDENTIGIKAIVKFGATPSKAPYNGDVMLEVMMNRHGGINSVTFTGNIVVMSPALPGGAEKIKEMAMSAVGGGKGMEKLMQALQGQVSASVKILFDNVNDVFHANMEMYINVVGGVVKGIGPNNRAGWAVMHFSKDEWYMLVGTPNDPIGLELLWLLKVKSYFMMGNNLPGSPPPPRQVSEILGISSSDLDYMRDLNAAESAGGFAIGLNLSMNTGNLRFLMFYANFSAGIGSDIMIKKYASEYHCSGSDETIGINGWYGNGQAYAYVQGKIGIKVKLRFYKGNFDILSIGVASILQAKGPNPFWMRGIVGGYYKILGGLVKGNCKFEVVIGKDCKVVGESNALEDIDIIAEVSPAKGENDVDVFNAPQAAFNIPIGEIFVITDIENRKRSFRGKLVDFKVSDGTIPVEGTIRWNDELDVAAFDTRDILPPKKQLNVTVKITFEELVNGSWKTVQFEGKDVEEIKETSFTTGEAPDHIPASNVLISYPIAGQYNFYPKEYNQGFIQLKKGQPYLFAPGEEWIQSLHLTNTEAQNYAETTLSYNVADKRVDFTIPSGLQNDKIYKVEILNLPKQQAVLDANIQNVETELQSGGEATLTTKNIEGDLTIRDAKTIYNSPFRTSKYNTFREKMAGIKLSITMNIPSQAGDMAELRSYLQGPEVMDRYELEGKNEYAPLITTEALLDNNKWYEQWVYPLVYEGYPLLGNIRTTRDTSLLGLPAVRAAFLEQLTPGPEVSGESTVTASAMSGYMRYDLMRTMMEDYRSIQKQVANYIVDRPDRVTDRLEKLVTKPFPFYRQGKYNVRLKYQIPGTNKTTSSYDWELYNAIPD